MRYNISKGTDQPGSEAAVLRDAINGDMLVIRSQGYLISVSIREIIEFINETEQQKKELAEIQVNKVEHLDEIINSSNS